MKLTKWAKMLLIAGSVCALAACSAHKRHDASVNDENAAYASDEAESSGYGDESGFSDRLGGPTASLAKRTYYFDFDSNVVRDEYKPAIAANANYLVAHSNARIIIEGHTDPRGSREYNIGLGERRAQAVANILRGKGVNPAQIRIVSYGAEKLAAPGRSEDDYQRDRRAVIVYMQR